MGRLRKRKPSVTHELSERERTLQQKGMVGSFIDTRPCSSRWFKSPDSRPGERPPVAHTVGSPMRHIYSLPCYGSPAPPASTQRPSLLLAVWYLLGRVSRSVFPIAVGDVSADAFPPGGYISCTLITPRLNGGVGTPICVRRVKLRLPYSPVAAEIANSSAGSMKQRLTWFEANLQDSSNPTSTKHRRNHV